MRTDISPQIQHTAALERLQSLRNRQELPKNDHGTLKKVADEFEGLLLEQMVREMRKTVPKTDLLGDRKHEDLFSEMLDSEFVYRMTQRGGIGIADLLLQDWERAGITR
jgi:Rod binding domain-containing protein